MPIYEYQCDACSYQWELIQRFDDPPPSHCPSCGTVNLRKKVSKVAFRLSGDGWYETDFKSGENKKNLVKDSENKSTSASENDSGKSSSGTDEKSSVTTEVKKDEKKGVAEGKKDVGKNSEPAS